MNKRRILELAAKSAGIGPLDFDYATREGHFIDSGPRLPLPQGVLIAAMYTYWNPIDDDGDALRLAAQVGLSISPSGFDDEVDAWIDGEPAQNATASWEEHDGDKAAAWRMAIVCAAAEIGKAMP